MQIPTRLFCIVLLNLSVPETKPTIPSANICHGVHGPWTKKKFDANALTAPIKNPASLPKHIPETMTSAADGLNCGSAENAIRPTVVSAHITLIITISALFGLRLSNDAANGTNASKMMSRLIK